MLRKLLLAIVPVAALAGTVRADDFDGLVGLTSDSSFEIDALTAALTDDDTIVDDDEVMPLAGSEAMDDGEIDADVVGHYYRRFRSRYYGGHRYRSFGYRHYRYRSYGYRHYGYRSYYRPTYYRPVYRYTYPSYVYHHHCW